ncbi:MAG: rRNA maturation RNase YbeY [Proteobacteria bacterium]|nr:rRNA maturation RNase YbeY [Pseudomonadota bacterium]
MTALIKNSQKYLQTDKRLLQKITEDLLTFSGQQGKDLSILFVDNKKIARFNKQFFGKDRPTNVISFSYMENKEIPVGYDLSNEIIGDIIISLEKAKEEAEALSCPFYERVFALIIHGLLHILGHDHINDRNKARRMRYKEKKLLDYVCSHQLYKELTG